MWDALFMADSNKSPICPAMASIKEHGIIRNDKERSLKKIWQKTNPTIIDIVAPPNDPSIVLFGLMLGESFVFPKNVPV
jgi:hypothetical protein